MFLVNAPHSSSLVVFWWFQASIGTIETAKSNARENLVNIEEFEVPGALFLDNIDIPPRGGF